MAFKKPWLYLPPKLAHDLSPLALKILPGFSSKMTDPAQLFRWKNLTFRNRFGIAGGVDKNAVNCLDWQRLGAGFLEVGTITPKSQGPNPGKIISRDVSTKSLWNKMGFPNDGSDKIFQRLEKIKPKLRIPLFVNIGKNRETTNEESHKDYAFGIQKFSSVADVFTVNISSPNTTGLRALQSKEFLQDFLQKIQAANVTRKPMLLKLSPDLSFQELETSIQIAAEYVDGFILTNTTTNREMTKFYPKEGGVSGLPLQKKSIEMLQSVTQILGASCDRYLIVSCGGILSPNDAEKRLQLGAHLVQTYTGLIYYGPYFFQDCCLSLKMV